MVPDVEGSTQMLSSKGFTLSHEIMKAYESIIEEKIIEHAGRRIKGLGDGVMVSFGSTRHAVECAIEIQRAIGEYSKQNPERKLKIRIGINTGEVVEEAGGHLCPPPQRCPPPAGAGESGAGAVAPRG